MTEQTPTARALPMFAALAERDYRRFWVAQFISNIGTWMQTVAQGWLVLKLTNSPFLLGFVGFANSVPILLLMLPGGVLADQVDRQRLLRFAQAAQALCALFLAASVYFQTLSVWQIAGVAAVLGVSTAFSSPTYQALVLDLLGNRSLLANAIAMNSLQFNLSRVIGPLIAGIVLSWAGPFFCFLFNAASFLPLLWVLSTTKRRQRPVIASEQSLLTRLLEGITFVKQDRRVRILLLMVAAASLFGYPFITFMPELARLYFGQEASGLAILMGALGAGALCGSLVLALRQHLVTEAIPLILITLLSFSLALGSIYFLQPVWLVGVALFLCGLSMVSCIGSINTYLQHLIPDHMRGRVLSMYTFSFFGVLPFGNLLGGVAAERWGVRTMFLMMSSGLLVCAFLAAWRLWRAPSLS